MKSHRLWLLPLGFVLALLVPCPGTVQAHSVKSPLNQALDRASVTTVSIRRRQVYDGDLTTRVVELRFADGTGVTVTGSEGRPFIRYLLAHDGELVDMIAGPKILELLPREGGR